MMRFVKLGLILLCCLMMGACVTQPSIRESFEKSVKRYNQMLRWQEVEAAGMAYVEPKLQEDFMKSAERIRKKHVTITDYRILTLEYQPDKESGVVMTEFDYYILPSNRIKTISYQQQWSYHDSNWQLKNGLPAFE